MRRPPGFTLLEVLVAVAVLGMLILLLNQGLDFGLRATAMQGRTDERQGDLEAVDRALRQLIERASPTGPFLGDAATLSLTTELPDPADGQLDRVEAALAVSGGQLHLRWRPSPHVRPLTPPPPPRDLVLLAGVSGMRLAYGETLVPAWSSDHLPSLVRLQLTFDNGRHWPPIIAAPRRDPPRP